MERAFSGPPAPRGAARRSGSSDRRPSPARRRPGGPRRPATPPSPPPSRARRPGSRGSGPRRPSARPFGRGDRRVRVAARPDVGDRDRVGCRRGRRRSPREGPPFGGTSVARTPPRSRRPGLALADGGERLADRRRVVAVVVEHDHAGGLALPLEPAAHARRTTPARRRSSQERPRPPGRPRPRRGHSRRCGRPAVGRRTARPPRSGVEAVDLEIVPSVLGRSVRASAGPDRRPWRTRSAIPRAKLAIRWRSASTSAVATIRPGQSRPQALPRARATLDRRPTFAMSDRRSADRGVRPRGASASNAPITAARSAKTSGWSHSAM